MYITLWGVASVQSLRCHSGFILRNHSTEYDGHIDIIVLSVGFHEPARLQKRRVLVQAEKTIAEQFSDEVRTNRTFFLFHPSINLVDAPPIKNADVEDSTILRTKSNFRESVTRRVAKRYFYRGFQNFTYL